MSVRAFLRSHPVFVAGFLLGILALLAVDGWLIHKRRAYSAEIARLQANMSEAERARTELVVASDENKIRLAIELARRQARLDNRLHLTVEVDSGVMYLEREGAILRRMNVQLGPERTVGIEPDTVRLAVPRGERTVSEILRGGSWTVPEWVYVDRGIAPERERTIAAALGQVALVLDGGTVIYSMPAAGPLADSVYVLPGSVRASPDDLRAILESVEPGMKVYLH